MRDSEVESHDEEEASRKPRKRAQTSSGGLEDAEGSFTTQDASTNASRRKGGVASRVKESKPVTAEKRPMTTPASSRKAAQVDNSRESSSATPHLDSSDRLDLPSYPDFEDDLSSVTQTRLKSPSFKVPELCVGLRDAAVYNEIQNFDAGPYDNDDNLNQYGLPKLFPLPHGCGPCGDSGHVCQWISGRNHNCIRCKTNKKGCLAVQKFGDDDVSIAHALARELQEQKGREYEVITPALKFRVLQKRTLAELAW